jgi:signal transduction histidine kinase
VWIRDVTETRRYERMLRESQQRVIVGGLAAGLAHEVNNPLAFVASNLQQIHRIASFEPAELEPLEKRRAEELSELSEVVAETIEGLARITGIVGRIIRPGTASKDDFVRLDLARMIEDAVRLIEFHGQYPLGARVLPAGELPRVDGSPERLSQALLNLVLNAQQACQSHPGSVVTLEARAEDGGVGIHIGVQRDGGEAWLDATPEVATSGPNAEAELSAAYEIVREHGGSLEAGSERGALFLLRLPAA